MRKVGKVLAMLAAAAITAGALAGCGSGAADKESSAAVNGSQQVRKTRQQHKEGMS